MDFNENTDSIETIPSSVTYGFYRSRIYTSDVSINPLITACDPILTLIATLKTIEYPSERNKFLEDLAHEIRAFEYRARMANYPENIIADARYVLCCLLDETIALTSAWGKNGGWLQNNLLTIFHNENYGGEHFFTIINHALENIVTNLHLIELLYLCLSFGFAGKYHNTEHGKSELASITNNLYQIICQYRRVNHRNLFICDPKPKLQPQQIQKPTITPQFKDSKLIRIAFTTGLIVSSIIYFSIYLKLHNISKLLYSQIEYNIDFKDKNQP